MTKRSYKIFSRSNDLVQALRPIRSHREVARMLGISRGSVFFIERIALEKIRRRLLEAMKGAR